MTFGQNGPNIDQMCLRQGTGYVIILGSTCAHEGMQTKVEKAHRNKYLAARRRHGAKAK